MSSVYAGASSRIHVETLDRNLTVCMLEPLPAYTLARTVTVVLFRFSLRSDVVMPSVRCVYVGAATRVHGTTPNRTRTVCMLNLPLALLPARTVHGGQIQLECSIRFCNAECPVCMLEPRPVYTATPMRNPTVCFLEPPRACRPARTVLHAIVEVVC